MKSTGMVRKIDELGRIVLPIEIRKAMDISNHDALEIYVEEGAIILKKYEPACIFCGSANDVTLFRGKLVCAECCEGIRSAVH